MRIEIIKQFVTDDESKLLNDFALDCVKKDLFENGKASKHLNKDGAHMVSRFNKNLEYPKVALEVKQRIMDCFGFKEDMTFTLFNETGIAVNCTFKDGQLWEHIDSGQPGNALLRCTVVSSQPKIGGIFHVEKQPIELEDNDLYACLVSEHQHFCTKNEDDKPRIVWQFGFNISKENWNNGSIKLKCE